MTHGQLPNPLGHKIHQQSGVWNDFRRFLKKLAGHTVRLSATRLDADGTGRRNDGKESRFVKRFYFTSNAIPFGRNNDFVTILALAKPRTEKLFPSMIATRNP